MLTLTTSSSDKKNRPTLERATKQERPPLRLTQRDLEIVKAVYLYRALTTPQVELLLFPPLTPGAPVGRKTKCRERLQKLFHHGYLWRGEIPTVWTEGKKPFVYRIDKRALEWLPNLLGLEPEEIDWKPSERTVSDSGLNHLLKTNDVRIALTVGVEPAGFRISQWVDERQLKRNHADEKVMITDPQGQVKPAVVIPDGFFTLLNRQTKKTAYHFLEVDLKTETVQTDNTTYRDWTRKVKAYIAYYNSNLFTRRYQAKNFRVLTVTASQRRLHNLKKKTEEAGGQKLFWFTTFDQLTAETAYTAPIWSVASLEDPLSLVYP